MGDRELVKAINFGQREYKLLKNIKIIDEELCAYIPVKKLRQKYSLRVLYTKKIMPYLVRLNNHRKLLKKLEEHHKKFEKFVKTSYEEETIGYNKKFKIEIETLIVKKSFLSYLIQAEDKLKEQLSRSIEKKEKKYVIINTKELREKRILLYDYKQTRYKFCNEECELQLKPHYTTVYDFKKHDIKPITKTATIKDGRVHIDDQELEIGRVGENPETITLYETQYEIKSDYDELLELTREFFENVNTSGNESGWDEYLEQESRKLLKYMVNTDEELKKLQEEYRR